MGSHIHEIQGITIDDLLQPDAFLIQNNFIPSPNEAATDSSSSSFVRSSSNSNSNSTNSSTLSPPLSFQEQDSTDDSVIFSDFVFSYIDRMLMEEERFDGQYHPADMLATEQQFSSILGGGPTDEPPLTQFVPAQQVDLVPVQTAAIDWLSDFAHNTGDKNPYDITSNDHSLFYGDADNLINFDAFNGWQHDSVDLNQLNSQLLFANTNSFSSLSSLSPTTTANSDSPGSENRNNISSANVTSTVTTDTNTTTSASNKTVEVGLEESMFRKGLEEAQKFLPKAAKLFIDVESTDFNVTRHEPAPQSKNQFLPTIEVKEEENNSNSTKSISPKGQQRGRKHPYRDRDEVEKEDGRNNKQVAYMEEETIREMFDKVLLGGQDKYCKDIMALREAKHDEEVRIATQASASGNTKGRGRRKAAREVVDLRTILIHCAQAVATDDRRSANELLRQIRHHASPTGDATQRLAQCFSDGLQARLAGTGSHLYESLVAKRTSAAELLKAYQLYMAACPFKKISFYFSNQTILDVSEGAERVHIIDFGIHYGFQWPCLLQRLSSRTSRKGGPPHLKITGIDYPQPGFRPAERLQETGRRLSDYAAQFKVPFEYKAIAAKWETVKVEDIDIDPNEVTVVNCLFQLKNLPDETVTTDSPRDVVLKLIRKINPHVFVHGIVNGSYSAPFFVTRFREALFHYSALFDMLDANVPKEDEHRLLIERDLFGRSALNVIACEGLERVERPETYKQWQVRDMRAGFKQLPLNDEIVTKAREKVKKCYHKDFVMDVDHGWLLQGWKGRIVYGMSTWKASGLA